MKMNQTCLPRALTLLVVFNELNSPWLRCACHLQIHHATSDPGGKACSTHRHSPRVAEKRVQ
jgi:hypothetical protein